MANPHQPKPNKNSIDVFSGETICFESCLILN